MQAKQKQVLVFVVLVSLLGAVQLRGPVTEMLRSAGIDTDVTASAEEPNQIAAVEPMQAGILWQRPKATPADLRDPMFLDLTPPEPPPEPPKPVKVEVKEPEPVVAKVDPPLDPPPPPPDPEPKPEPDKPIDIVTTRADARGAPVQLDTSTPVFYLKGIVHSKMGSSTIITDTGILRVGDVIHGARVVQIDPRSVEFRKHEQTYIVRVGQKPSDAQ